MDKAEEESFSCRQTIDLTQLLAIELKLFLLKNKGFDALILKTL